MKLILEKIEIKGILRIRKSQLAFLEHREERRLRNTDTHKAYLKQEWQRKAAHNSPNVVESHGRLHTEGTQHTEEHSRGISHLSWGITAMNIPRGGTERFHSLILSVTFGLILNRCQHIFCDCQHIYNKNQSVGMCKSFQRKLGFQLCKIWHR